MKDSTEVFSNRVHNYFSYRPGYTLVLLDVLREKCSFNDESVIADIGSGTGLLSELFLKNGNIVFGIEPNPEMRKAGERRLKSFPRFTSVQGRAEATTLANHSVDFVTAGQAFHWFNQEQIKNEFTRILKPQGWIVVVYNEMQTDTPFLRACQEFYITYLADQSAVAETDIYTPFFGEGNFTKKQVEGVSQKLDLTGLIGRVLSRANAPEENSPLYAEMMDALDTIFEQYQRDRKVEISYTIELVFGHLSEP